MFLNPAFGSGFCKSARWFAKSRGRVQRHPDYLCQAIAVLEAAGHTCYFIDGAAKDISFKETRTQIKEFKPDMVVIQASTPSIYSDLKYARLCKKIINDIKKYKLEKPEDIWSLSEMLLKREKEMDQIYDYRYSQLIMVFAILIKRGFLSIKDLKGLSEDKLDQIEKLRNL